MRPPESELILNEDGNLYHLNLKGHQIADHVLLVGDPVRVKAISACFDELEFIVENREFVTHTGFYKGIRITALSTGIGTDNIDIVVNELDAAVNFDLEMRKVKDKLRSLNLIRIGTCGAVQKNQAIESRVITEFAIGLDGVKHFYDIAESEAEEHVRIAFEGFTEFDDILNTPYVAEGSKSLFKRFDTLGERGLTLTANGFFGPQGRRLRLPLAIPDFNATIDRFEVRGKRILNYEMESSALFALGKALGHKCACICLVIANRKAQTFSKAYHTAMQTLIKDVLNALVA